MDGAKRAEALNLQKLYPGMDKEHVINSQGNFVNRKVRKLEKTANYLKPSATQRKTHTDQHTEQESIYGRRIEILNTHGDFTKAINQIEASEFTNKGGKLQVTPSNELEASIKGIKTFAKIPTSNNETKAAITEAGLLRRSQKDLTLFFGHCLNSARSPHAVFQLQEYINREVDSGGISPSDQKTLLEQIDKKYGEMAKALPATLNQMTASKQSPPNTVYSAERKKQAYVHELSVAMAKGQRTDLLKKKSRKLADAAVQAFANNTNVLKPHNNDLEKTLSRYKDIEESTKNYLSPVLKLTGKDSSSKMLERAKEATLETVKTLQDQLSAIPKAVEEKKDSLNELHKLVQKVKVKTREAYKLADQFYQAENNYLELKRAASSSKFIRRFNIPYQIKRRENRQHKKQIQAQQRATRDEIKNKSTQIKQEQHNYSLHQLHLNQLLKQFGDSVDVVHPALSDPNKILESSAYSETFESLKDAGLLEEVDTILAQEFFNKVDNSILATPSAGYIQQPLADEFEKLIRNEGYSPRQALWILENSMSKEIPGEFEQGCQTAINFLTDHAGLHPERSVETIPAYAQNPYVQEIESELAHVNPDDIGSTPNAEVVQFFQELTAEHPELSNEIDELCHFLIDGFEADSEWVEAHEMQDLFNDHFNAIKLGAEELIQNNGTMDSAFDKMTNHLEIRDTELRS